MQTPFIHLCHAVAQVLIRFDWRFWVCSAFLKLLLLSGERVFLTIYIILILLFVTNGSQSFERATGSADSFRNTCIAPHHFLVRRKTACTDMFLVFSFSDQRICQAAAKTLSYLLAQEIQY